MSNRLKTGSGWALACNLHCDLQTWFSCWTLSGYSGVGTVFSHLFALQ